MWDRNGTNSLVRYRTPVMEAKTSSCQHGLRLLRFESRPATMPHCTIRQKAVRHTTRAEHIAVWSRMRCRAGFATSRGRRKTPKTLPTTYRRRPGAAAFRSSTCARLFDFTSADTCFRIMASPDRALDILGPIEALLVCLTCATPFRRIHFEICTDSASGMESVLCEACCRSSGPPTHIQERGWGGGGLFGRHPARLAGKD
jgi:hypothetical protein